MIRLGLPTGSLNTPGRGNTSEVLSRAGFVVEGYEPGKESGQRLRIVNDPEITALLTRPQSAPEELNLNLLDIAIIGSDWAREGQVPLEKIGDLGYGGIRLVTAASRKTADMPLSERFAKKGGLLCFTEYVNLARQFYMTDTSYQQRFGGIAPLMRVRGIVIGDNPLVQIVLSDGNTEGYIAKGADLIVENTQSGRSLKEHDLVEMEEIMQSEAGLYARQGLTSQQGQKAEELLRMLRGAVRGQEYFDVKFNIPSGLIPNVSEYLLRERLCADEPTIVAGMNFSQVNVLVPQARFPELQARIFGDFNGSALVRNAVEQYIE